MMILTSPNTALTQRHIRSLVTGEEIGEKHIHVTTLQVGGTS